MVIKEGVDRIDDTYERGLHQSKRRGRNYREARVSYCDLSG